MEYCQDRNFSTLRVCAAGFLEREQTPAHRGNYLGLAPDDPALGARRRQIGDRERTAVRSDNVPPSLEAAPS